MAEIKWKTVEEIEAEKNAPSPLSDIDALRDYVLDVDYRLIMLELGMEVK